MLKFRKLTADEIDCRVQIAKDTGCSILLYKDARVDQIILDETVGAMNWQRTHSRDNANCTVSLWDEDKKQWVSKEDTGKESNTEAEKGLASDSFKRACFNWGIGRELYTAPFIWINGYTEKNSKGNWVCNTRFSVSSIEYDAKGNISKLEIVDSVDRVVYSMGKSSTVKAESNNRAKEDSVQSDGKISASQVGDILNEMKRTGITSRTLFYQYQVNDLSDLTVTQYKNIMDIFKHTKNKEA